MKPAWQTMTNREMGVSAKAELYFLESLLMGLKLMDKAAGKQEKPVSGRPERKAGDSEEVR